MRRIVVYISVGGMCVVGAWVVWASRTTLPFSTPPHDSIRVVVGGDVMFDRSIRKYGEKYGYESLLHYVAPLFKRADIAVVNLEGPITLEASKTLLPSGETTRDLMFTFATSTASALARSHITLVSLANNHTSNFGLAGLVETHYWLSQAGMRWFGSPYNETGKEAVVCRGESRCIAFVGYHEFVSGFEGIVDDVKRLSSRGYPVIVYAHWGDEYVSTTSPRLKQKAHMLVQAGAVAVIGAHPHVIGEYEWIEGTPVIYSLGNLVFDQYFSPRVMQGYVAELVLKNIHERWSVEYVRLHKVSNTSREGPRVVDDPIEIRPIFR